MNSHISQFPVGTYKKHTRIGPGHEGVAIRNSQSVLKARISQRMGGDQIDYADEEPMIRHLFAEALAKHGLQPRRDKAHEMESTDLSPKSA